MEGGREEGREGGREGERKGGREGEVQLEQEHEGRKVGMGDTIQVHLIRSWECRNVLVSCG